MKKKERRMMNAVDKKYGLPKGFTEKLKEYLKNAGSSDRNQNR